MRISLVILSTSLALFSSFADAKGSHGGDAIACYDRPIFDSHGNRDFKAKLLESPILKDFWEFNNTIVGLQLSLGGNHLNFKEKVEFVLSRLEKVDHVRAKRLREVWAHPNFFKLVERAQIPEVDDAISRISPQVSDGRHCYDFQAAAQTRNPMPYQARVLIDLSIFNSMDADNQAGLILHELILFQDLERGIYSAPTTDGTRWFNGIISSNYIDKLEDIQDSYSVTYAELIKNNGLDYASEKKEEFGKKNLTIYYTKKDSYEHRGAYAWHLTRDLILSVENGSLPPIFSKLGISSVKLSAGEYFHASSGGDIKLIFEESLNIHYNFLGTSLDFLGVKSISTHQDKNSRSKIEFQSDEVRWGREKGINASISLDKDQASIEHLNLFGHPSVNERYCISVLNNSFIVKSNCYFWWNNFKTVYLDEIITPNGDVVKGTRDLGLLAKLNLMNNEFKTTERSAYINNRYIKCGRRKTITINTSGVFCEGGR